MRLYVHSIKPIYLYRKKRLSRTSTGSKDDAEPKQHPKKYKKNVPMSRLVLNEEEEIEETEDGIN